MATGQTVGCIIGGIGGIASLAFGIGFANRLERKEHEKSK